MKISDEDPWPCPPLNLILFTDEAGVDATSSDAEAVVSGHYERRYLGLVAKLASLQVDLDRQAAAANTVLYVMDDAIQKPQLALENEATGTTTVSKAWSWPVLRIHDILVRILIRILLFSSWTFKTTKKKKKNKSFMLITF
jgi:hypothetical protein